MNDFTKAVKTLGIQVYNDGALKNASDQIYRVTEAENNILVGSFVRLLDYFSIGKDHYMGYYDGYSSRKVVVSEIRVNGTCGPARGMNKSALEPFNPFSDD